MPVAQFLDVVPVGLNFQHTFQRVDVKGVVFSGTQVNFTTREGVYTAIVEVMTSATFDATVGNRTVKLSVVVAVGQTQLNYITAGVFTASQTPTVVFGTYLTAVGFSSVSATVPLPPVLYPPGTVFQAALGNPLGSDTLNSTGWTVNEYWWDGSGDGLPIGGVEPELSAAAPA